MEDEVNGSQEGAQGAENQAQGQQQENVQAVQEVAAGGAGSAEGVSSGNDGTAADWQKQISERDARIAELEGQVSEAAKTAETAEKLRGEVAEVKAQAESDRIDFSLQLAGARNVKAARALFSDHGGDVDALKAAEPWLFSGGDNRAEGNSASAGATGLPNAGAATDAGKTMKRWREIAGLPDDDSK